MVPGVRDNLEQERNPVPRIDIYDNLNGSFALEWGTFPGITPASYNVYQNGVEVQSVTIRSATVSGLTQTTYSNSTIAASSGNSLRPQNMPPVGTVTPANTYAFYVTAVVGGIEVARTPAVTVTPNPFSIMLTTPMKRPFPYPNTGSPDG